MKIREMFLMLVAMLKRFLTLNVRDHKGFTLVELIIVIAILAILSSVAVVGYSSYVTKANMQADETLIAEIKNALTLAYYSGELSDSGYIILSTDGVVEFEGVSLSAVLANSFGGSWSNTMKLKYNGWTASPAFKLLKAEAAQAVANSSFVTGADPEAVLETVSSLTNAMTSALGTKDDAIAAIESNLNAESIAAIKDQFDVESLTELDNTELSNFMLLAVANEMNGVNDGTVQTPSNLVQLVTVYATIYGFANSNHASDADKAAFQEMQDAIVNSSNADLTEFDGSYSAYAFDQIAKFQEKTDDSYNSYIESSTATTDVNALLAIMGALNEGKGDLELEDLGNSQLATNGALGEYYKGYVNAAIALAGAVKIPTVTDGQIALCFSVKNGIVFFSTIE